MSRILASLFRSASNHFGELVHRVRDDQWTSSTPCTDWDVRALVNHLVGENLWVPPLLAGKTIEDVGDAFDGDVLGDDPIAAWDRAVAPAQAGFSGVGAMELPVHLSFGETPAEEYAFQLTTETTRSTRGTSLVRSRAPTTPWIPSWSRSSPSGCSPQIDDWRSGGAFVNPVTVPDDADPQTKLLAETGRAR